MMPKQDFSPENLERVNNAIKKAERKSTGEITVSVIKESYDYAAQELMFGIFAGLVYFLIMMLCIHRVEPVIQSMFWDYSPHYLLAFYGFSSFLVIFIFYLIGNIPFMDRLIVSRKLMQKKVNERAVRHFMESGVYNTKDRTGILIFISILEKRAELLADRGISKKIPQHKWDSIMDHLIQGIKSNQFIDHIQEAISECGELLAHHFPVDPDDRNELCDDLQVLEKKS
jgi:putative membrane protein